MSVSLIDGHIDDDVMTDKQIRCLIIKSVCGGCPLSNHIGKQKEEIERLKYNIESLEYELEDVKYGDG